MNDLYLSQVQLDKWNEHGECSNSYIHQKPCDYEEMNNIAAGFPSKHVRQILCEIYTYMFGEAKGYNISMRQYRMWVL